MTLVLLSILQGRTPGGHGLLEAVPRIYQVTPDIPDRRRATKQKEVRPSPADSLKESQLAARSGPSPPRRTSPTSPMRTASLRAAARLTKPPSRGALRSGGDAAEAHMRAMAPAADDVGKPVQAPTRRGRASSRPPFARLRAPWARAKPGVLVNACGR